jgi:hypothetical protein
MVNDILGILPNILGAALILVVGWMIARIIRQIVTNLLVGVGIDRIGGTDTPLLESLLIRVGCASRT